MKIGELTRNAIKLEQVKYLPIGENGNVFSRVAFLFEEGVCLEIGVDIDTDELVWVPTASPSDHLVDLVSLYPSIGKCYGRSLLWSWEMVNQQGYFDALQLEFSGREQPTFQFKGAGSGIRVFELLPLGSR